MAQARVAITQHENNKLTVVTIGKLDLYFSYETIVAFNSPENGMICSENIWSNTTARHLNVFCSKENRIPYEQFTTIFENYMEGHNL